MKIKVIYLNDSNNASHLVNKLNALNNSAVSEKLTSNSQIDTSIEMVVVYIEENLHLNSEFDTLIEKYNLNGTRIVAVHSVSRNNYKIPRSLEEIADAVICWDDLFLKKVIQGENIFVDAECQELPKKKIRRHNC